MVLIISVLIGMALDWADAKPAVKYFSSKYDHIDVEAILNNRRMVNYYSSCLLSQGPCPPEGVEFKRILPEALQTNCGRCTEKQAAVALRAIRRLKKEYPKIWSQLNEKWDPNDVYVKRFESTFGSKSGPGRPSQDSTTAGNRFDLLEPDHPAGNTIDANISQTATTGQGGPDLEHQPDSTTHKITTNPPFSTSTKSASSSTTRPPSVPGLVPFNTFFTNPPIPIRPIVNLNLGGNIGATVKAIKQVEKMVADIALEKIGIIRSILLVPWTKSKKGRYA